MPATADADAIEYRCNSGAPIVANDNRAWFFGAKAGLVMFALPESGR
jgi:hypothetical protein